MPKQSDQDQHLLAKAYEFTDIEKKWYQKWQDDKNFKATMDDDKPSFSIVIPPPNVTGVLHVGHALNNTMQDILIRYKRMMGFNTVWIPGTDHAGIATQNVVERQLATENLSRHDVGREEFIKRVWKWKSESGGQIINQLKRLGCSCDWERERFTMDEGLSRSVRTVFTRLYEEGLIYRGDYIINWCPRCHTALADLEVEHEDTNGRLYRIRYPFVNGNGYLVVATTRPETMLGDTGVAVHPDDERFNSLDDKRVILPIVNREIPIVFDDHVEQEFGTGALKVTPAHDLNDFEIAQRHDLPAVTVMDENGCMTSETGPYAGMDRFACREQVVADLEKLGLLDGIDEYQHGVGHCYRCQTVVEPSLSKQWFVTIKPLAEKAIKAVENGDIKIHPKSWESTFFNWMNNIRDWCISRQIWWGHQIPAWTCDSCGEMIISEEDPTSCPECQGSKLIQETDVLDTWFSSALWPFSTLGWPDETPDLRFFYPTSVLITSFDILFFWVSRMMMMGLHFMEDIPFKDVYLHALVRDANGDKMSKSKGNVMDPLLVMDKYGTDALRFTMTAFAAQGRDIRLSEERIEGYRHFINKIWNASRFALMHVSNCQPGIIEKIDYNKLSFPHAWILSRLDRTIGEVHQALADFRYNDAAMAMYQFTWHEFCDWYVELIKPELFADSEEEKEQARAVLLLVLETSLKLMHPVIPFITEEIWHALPGHRTSIMTEAYPQKQEQWHNPQIEKDAEVIMGVIGGIRNIRSEMQIHPSATVECHILCQNQERLTIIRDHAKQISNLTKVSRLELADKGESPEGAAAFIFEDIEIFIPLAGLIDVAAELAKLGKEQKKLEKQLKQSQGKLTNEKFMAKAPAEVIAKEKERVATLSATLTKIEENKKRMAEIDD